MPPRECLNREDEVDMSISTKRDTHKKYTVQGFSGSRFAKTDTLAEAKRAGLAIAKKEAYRGKWNSSIMPVSISKQDAPDSSFYKSTGWVMYVPVTVTGKPLAAIEYEIKRRYGVKPFVWTRR